jgi:RHS repeat-associated protein
MMVDALGSTRAVTDETGAAKELHDYLPFGAEIRQGGSRSTALYIAGTVKQRFTGKERDTETGLDWFEARYFSAAQGRFTSPDSTAYSKLINPQSWNLYAYAFNNPLRNIDPTGHEVQAANCSTQVECQKVLKAVQGALGNQQAAARVGLQQIQRTGFFSKLWASISGAPQFRFTISGDVGSFRTLGANASKFADLVSSSKVVEAGVSETYKAYGGGQRTTPGGITLLPSQGFDPSRVTVSANPSGFDADTAGFINGGPGSIPGANVGETMAHELLGHAWGELIGGHASGTFQNMQDSVAAENAVRNTDPSQGLKSTHHSAGEPVVVFTMKELESQAKKR